MLEPGEVFYLPPEEDEPLGKGDRPHLLLSLCNSQTEVYTFAYGSTKATDALRGAEHVLVDPFSSRDESTGLNYPTYIYPSRLVSYAADELDAPAGRIVGELPVIRASLARAIGIGMGATAEANAPGSNRRGRLVEIAPALAEKLDARFAAVVTEPGYSRHGFQQTVIPLLDGGCDVQSLDVVARHAAWCANLGDEYETAILATSLVSTLYLPKHILRFLDAVVPNSVMVQVDSALENHFGL